MVRHGRAVGVNHLVFRVGVWGTLVSAIVSAACHMARVGRDHWLRDVADRVHAHFLTPT